MPDRIVVRAPEGFAELVPVYLAQTRRQLDAALGDGSLAALRTLGHNLRGSAAPFGLDVLGEIGRRLERHAIDGADADARACAAELQDHLDRLVILPG